MAVIGGGNSGIEAAIDLAGICSKVTVFEFLEELKADQVLQEKAKSLPNVEILVNSQTTEVVGDKEKVTGIRTKDRTTGNERLFPLDGIFVQIGLAANSSAFKEIVATNRLGEIIIDAHCRTDIPGIYAAGDVSGIEEASSAMVEGRLAGCAAAESLGYEPVRAAAEKEDARAELSELRSGPAGARILSGLEKARKLRLEHDICRKGGASVC